MLHKLLLLIFSLYYTPPVLSEISQDVDKNHDEIELLLRNEQQKDCAFCVHRNQWDLDEKTLPELLKNDGITVVLYWLNVDTESKLAYYLWHSLNQSSVACHDWTDVCRNMNINYWPRLIAYKNGKLYKSYRGPWIKNAMNGWLSLITKEPIQFISSAEDKSAFLDEFSNIPAFSVLFCYAECTEEKKTFERAADKLHGRFVLAYSTKIEWLKDIAIPRKPFLATFRADKVGQPKSILTELESVEKIIDFVLASSKPAVIKQTNETIPTILKSKSILFVVHGENEEFSLVFDEIRAQLGSEEILFVSDKKTKILNATMAQTQLIFLHEHKRYEFDLKEDEEKEEVLSWIRQVLNGSAQPKADLTELPLKEHVLMRDHMPYFYGEKARNENNL